MRILYQPETLVLRCSECDTIVELEKWERVGSRVLNLSERGGEDGCCPTCGYPFSMDDRISKEISIKQASSEKCKGCGVIIGENDKFCNSCGAPI